MSDGKLPVAQRRVAEDAEVGLLEVACPLCDGKGRLSRAYLYEQLGVRDMAKLATHTAKEAVAELTDKLWGQYRDNLDKQVKAESERLKSEIDRLTAEQLALEARNKALNESIAEKERTARDSQKNEDQSLWLEEKQKYLDEAARIRQELAELKAASLQAESKERNAVEKATLESKGELGLVRTQLQTALHNLAQVESARAELEKRLSATAVQGRVEEQAFESEVATIPGIWIGEKLKKMGDYLIRLRGPNGEPVETSTLVVDNKDKDKFTSGDIDKLVRDAQHHKSGLAALVASDETCLRREDMERRFEVISGVSVLRTTRQWFARDLDLIRPLMRKQADEGPEFMKRNQSLAATVQSYFKEVDAVDDSLRLAEQHLAKARKDLGSYKQKMVNACEQKGDAVPKA